jgi:N-acyl-D-aspartate/D-glutamate deacylase
MAVLRFLEAFLDKLAALQKSLNVGSFLGQGSVRAAVIGLIDRPATAGEIDRMRALVLQGMRDGAFGLSTGLFYVREFSRRLQKWSSCKKWSRHGAACTRRICAMKRPGFWIASRKRSRSASRAACPRRCRITKLSVNRYWGRSVDTLKLIDEARARGVDATIDQYPYTASATSVQAALLPPWALEGGHKQTVERLKDAALRAKIKTRLPTAYATSAAAVTRTTSRCLNVNGIDP